MGSIYGGIRLIQSRYQVHHIDDYYKPPISGGKHTLLCVSASGETPSVCNAARIAHENKANVATLTASAYSALAKMSDIAIILNGDNKNASTKRKKEPIEYLGTVFENKTFNFMDTLANEIIKRKRLSESQLRKNHANLE